VKGSHGCLPLSPLDAPVLLARSLHGQHIDILQAPQVRDVIRGQLFPPTFSADIKASAEERKDLDKAHPLNAQ
jgi:hypothetical protein